MRRAFTASLWLYPGDKAAWHFVTVPKKETAAIDAVFKEFKKGWGSLPVTAQIHKTTWNTSIFPDRKSKTYLLPIKASIRKKESLEAGDRVRLVLTVLASG
jgi:hypothetical protein